jgi:hypothetical protein
LARRLDAIRAVLAAFDWEFSDRQIALEEIGRIAGGPPMEVDTADLTHLVRQVGILTGRVSALPGG